MQLRKILREGEPGTELGQIVRLLQDTHSKRKTETAPTNDNINVAPTSTDMGTDPDDDKITDMEEDPTFGFLGQIITFYIAAATSKGRAEEGKVEEPKEAEEALKRAAGNIFAMLVKQLLKIESETDIKREYTILKEKFIKILTENKNLKSDIVSILSNQYPNRNFDIEISEDVAPYISLEENENTENVKFKLGDFPSMFSLFKFIENTLILFPYKGNPVRGNCGIKGPTVKDAKNKRGMELYGPVQLLAKTEELSTESCISVPISESLKEQVAKGKPIGVGVSEERNAFFIRDDGGTNKIVVVYDNGKDTKVKTPEQLAELIDEIKSETNCYIKRARSSYELKMTYENLCGVTEHREHVISEDQKELHGITPTTKMNFLSPFIELHCNLYKFGAIVASNIVYGQKLILAPDEATAQRSAHHAYDCRPSTLEANLTQAENVGMAVMDGKNIVAHMNFHRHRGENKDKSSVKRYYPLTQPEHWRRESCYNREKIQPVAVMFVNNKNIYDHLPSQDYLSSELDAATLSHVVEGQKDTKTV